MNRKWVTVVGWLCIISAIVNIPLTAAYALFASMGGPFKVVVNPLISLIGLCVFLCIYITFRNLLRDHFKFPQVTWAIDTLILLNLISFLFSIQGAFAPEEPIPMIMVFILAGAFVNGIVLIVFAVKLLPLHDRFPAMKPYAYLLIAEGVLYCSVLFLVLAIIPSVVGGIVLGVGFLRLAGSQESESAAVHRARV